MPSSFQLGRISPLSNTRNCYLWTSTDDVQYITENPIWSIEGIVQIIQSRVEPVSWYSSKLCISLGDNNQILNVDVTNIKVSCSFELFIEEAQSVATVNLEAKMTIENFDVCLTRKEDGGTKINIDRKCDISHHQKDDDDDIVIVGRLSPHTSSEF